MISVDDISLFVCTLLITQVTEAAKSKKKGFKKPSLDNQTMMMTSRNVAYSKMSLTRFRANSAITRSVARNARALAEKEIRVPVTVRT